MKNKSLLKRITVFCIILEGCFASLSSQAFDYRQSEEKDIKIVPMPIGSPGAPRVPAYNPFYAELESGYVLLGSLSSCGIVDVSLTSTAGDDYSTLFDTADGTIIIPVSGFTGDYTLLITTASGVEYIGEFSI